MHVKRQLLFVQGRGAGAHDEWDNKLVESLKRELGSGYEIHYPQSRTKMSRATAHGRQRSTESSRRSTIARFSSVTRLGGQCSSTLLPSRQSESSAPSS